MRDRLIAAADAARDELVELTRALVRIPSENAPPGGAEAAVQRFIVETLRRAGLEPDVFTPDDVDLPRHPAFHPGRTYADRPDVVATLRGSGGGRSLVLSGHADTVPAGPSGWTDDPWSGAVRDGRLFGRGAFDMKGGLAAALLAVLILKRERIPLRGDILFESVVDEEFAGGHGTLAARLRGHRADAAVVPENSGMTVYHMHRGFWLVRLTVRGGGGIDFAGAAADLDNPLEHLGRLIEWVKAYRDIRRVNARVPAAYRHLAEPSPVLITKAGAGAFDDTAPIAVPDAATVEVYLQPMPGESRAELEAEFFGFLDPLLHADGWFRTHPVERSYPYRFIPGSGIPADHPLVACATESLAAATGRPAVVRAAPYPCDLYIFNDLFRTPGILLGPGGGNAHAPDEYVLIDDLVASLRTYLLLALRWAGDQNR